MAGMTRGRVWVVLVLIVAAVWALRELPRRDRPAGSPPSAGPRDSASSLSASGVEALYRERVSGREVEVGGRVDRLLPDDREGSPHQRFILRLASGHTLLIAHNIDVAPRVPVAVGDTVSLRGRYEWNEQGGVIHWTHDSSRTGGAGGWIRFGGRVYR